MCYNGGVVMGVSLSIDGRITFRTLEESQGYSAMVAEGTWCRTEVNTTHMLYYYKDRSSRAEDRNTTVMQDRTKTVPAMAKRQISSIIRCLWEYP